MKICDICSGDDFNSLGRCRPCWAKYMRAYNQRDYQQLKVKKRNKQYKKTDSYKNSCLKNRYGLTLEEYSKLENQQNFCCAVCKKPKKAKYLFVDHNHTTGKVRGLLCRTCNTALGLLYEDTQIMENLINYISSER